MTPGLALAALLALVAVATLAGLVWLKTTGRVRVRSDDAVTVVRPVDVETTRAFGERATLLQFSTEFCTFCPATRRLLTSLARQRDGVVHVDVDLTRLPEVARRFAVLQTPTTLVLDHRGAVRARIGGPPNPRALESELARLLGEDHVHA
ncbi:thiol reductase thioredoxin [Frondihabitans sucicola]|uniref:Thiol reductase thioredoxin n=1 Tax=Frondihabitans sucicola TaxID=1268041 RepID=A0ABM8GSH1_9MICO|nr:thioredoxin family protein [Frondihabitans sucicola]BDZ51409.1 thiol reductase thioredoxin [Frondihabitans sucicola]